MVGTMNTRTLTCITSRNIRSTIKGKIKFIRNLVAHSELQLPFRLMIGHFTQLVRDQAYAVGCAMAQYKKGRQYTTLYTCNYSLSNILDYPIYENTTNAASKCKSGTNIAYPGLCSTDEIYDYELFYN